MISTSYNPTLNPLTSLHRAELGPHSGSRIPGCSLPTATVFGSQTGHSLAPRGPPHVLLYILCLCAVPCKIIDVLFSLSPLVKYSVLFSIWRRGGEMLLWAMCGPMRFPLPVRPRFAPFCLEIPAGRRLLCEVRPASSPFTRRMSQNCCRATEYCSHSAPRRTPVKLFSHL